MNILQHIVVICALCTIGGITSGLENHLKSERVTHFCYKTGQVLFVAGVLMYITYTFYQLFVLAGSIDLIQI